MLKLELLAAGAAGCTPHCNPPGYCLFTLHITKCNRGHQTHLAERVTQGVHGATVVPP